MRVPVPWHKGKFGALVSQQALVARGLSKEVKNAQLAWAEELYVGAAAWH